MPRRKLTAASETLVLFIQGKLPRAEYEDARDLVEAAVASEVAAVAEMILRRLGRGEGRHYHLSSPAVTDTLTRSAVESIVRSEGGLT